MTLAPRSRQPPLCSHHTPRTLPASRGLRWEDGDGQPCWQISASWNCLAGGFAELISPDLRRSWEKRKSCEACCGLGLKGKSCSGRRSDVSRERCRAQCGLVAKARSGRQSVVVGPSGYFLYALWWFSKYRIHPRLLPSKCIEHWGIDLSFLRGCLVTRFSHPPLPAIRVAMNMRPNLTREVFAGGCGFTRHEPVSHPLTPQGISWCCGWTDGRGEWESRTALVNCWTKPKVGPDLGHSPMRLWNIIVFPTVSFLTCCQNI